MLYQEWQEGEYTPYADAVLENVLIKIKTLIPRYTRVERIFRDIPGAYIQAGNKMTNYREYLQAKMKAQGLVCQCIRCREVRDQTFEGGEEPTLFDEEYRASEGREHFISFESPNQRTLYAFLRLRFPSTRYREQIKSLKDTALIRELHTYGQLTPIGEKGMEAAQHRGFGKKLMAYAEDLARASGYKKLAVISGVGVRPYYSKLGYRLEKEFGYMLKRLTRFSN